ncbi:MAG TPA: ATP cone domain-containing protein [Candidatus Saccharimonadales bacterium]|nr:ATP cone domain-containing protein [Candidatus Saccharimonadales bacterium]
MINVIKADKKHEEFKDEKVLNSIRRAGIPKSLEQKVLEHIRSKLYDGISTSEIYRHIIEFLGESDHPFTKTSYSLKESIMALGPTGYPFEDFIAKLLEAHGYTTKVRQILSGECITHEIDVIASKNGKSAMIEAKFHNSPGTRSQIHVGLYTQARFEDIRRRNSLDEAWLVTNTKTTIDTNTYAQCKNIKIMSWSYPVGESLRDLIEATRLHPITILTTINSSQKKQLLDNHVVMCKDINQQPDLLDSLFLSEIDRQKVLSEVAYIARTE